MKTSLKSCFTLAAAFSTALFAWTLTAQEKATAEGKPKPHQGVGTFWSATRQMPPLPYHPFPDLMISKIGKNLFEYDDTEVDYKTIRAEAAEQAALLAEADGLADGAPEGGPMMLRSGESLRLSVPAITGTNLQFTILDGEPDGIYDLFVSTDLASTNAWAHALRTAPGQTNLQIATQAGNALTFRLGTMLDSDGDTISDAYENLITHTDPNTANTLQNAGTNDFLIWLLTKKSPKVVQTEIHRRHQAVTENSPCQVGPYTTLLQTLHWTNGIGGLQAEAIRQAVCDETTQMPVYTPGTNEVRWAADDSWEFRSQWADEPWSPWGNPDGATFTSPRLMQWAYRKTTNVQVQIVFDPPRTIRATEDLEMKFEVRTGGEPLSIKERLHAVTVQAQVDGVLGYVPPELITVAGRTLNSNYTAFFLWRDNTANDVTPVLPQSYTNYTFIIDHSHADLIIKVNGQYWSNTVQTVHAGQPLALHCELSGGTAVITNYQWAIEGAHISNWVASPMLGEVHYVTDYTNADISYYFWRRETNVAAECAVKVEGYEMSAQTRFTVLKPAASITATISNVIKVDYNFPNAGNPGIHFGDDVPPIPGIVFARTPDPVVQWNWLQLMDSSRKHRFPALGVWTNWIGSGLDSFPYPSKHDYSTSDSPAEEVSNGADQVQVQETFRMYLMYKPTGSSTIYVPVAYTQWTWAGQAGLTNGLWGLSSTPTAPTVQTPSDANDPGYPTWTNNFPFAPVSAPIVP